MNKLTSSGRKEKLRRLILTEKLNRPGEASSGTERRNRLDLVGMKKIMVLMR